MIHCNRNIKFEFEANSNSIINAIAKIFGKDDKSGKDVEESEASEEDISMLAKLLGGGM